MARKFVKTSSERINAGYISAIEGTANVSMSMWCKRNAAGNRGGMFKGSASTGPWEEIFIDFEADGNVYVSVKNSNTNAYGKITNNDTNWHHVVLVYDGGGATDADKLVMFFDGVKQSLTLNGPIPTTTASEGEDLYIGYRVFATRYFDCESAECKVWSSTLTDAEAVQDYYGNIPSRDTLVAYLPLLGDSPEPDYSGNGFNGTISGTPDITDHPGLMPQFGFDSDQEFLAIAAAAGNPHYYYAQQQLLAG
jgi:hypothetical protein